MFNSSTLASQTPWLLDGAWGTELQALGLAPGACPDAWNLSAPERVERVARAYVDAGSQVILTNSFGANRIVLSRHGLAEDTRRINQAAAAISLRAATGRAEVCASVGPTGKLLAMGDVTETQLHEVFEEQISALAEGGVGAVVLETFTDLNELAIAATVAKHANLLAIGCMVFDSGAKKDRTAMGVTLEQVVERLTALGIDAIGANCGRGVDAYVPICRRLRAATELPLWFKPNAGLPELVDGKATYATTPEEFAVGAMALVAEGANLIGGCCGTTPDFIQGLARAISDR